MRSQQNKANHVQKSDYWKDKNLVSDKTYQSAISFAEFDLAHLNQVRDKKKK